MVAAVNGAPKATPLHRKYLPTYLGTYTHTRDDRASGMELENGQVTNVLAVCLQHTKHKLLEDSFHAVTSQIMNIDDCNL